MAMVAHDPKAAKRLGIPQSVGKEFVSADKGKKFSRGGEMDKKDLAQDKKMVKKAVGMHEKQLHGGKKADLSKLCGGGKVKKMAGGGLAAGHKSADGCAVKGKTRGTQVAMKKGGKC
jgi:hypothetical protein